MSAVAYVQVQKRVRRPIAGDTFIASEIHEDGRLVHVRGHWRGHHEERAYILPAGSIVAIRQLDGGQVAS